MRRIMIPFMLTVAMAASAQNPIIRDQYAADPTALIDTTNGFRSFEATMPQKGSWLRYDDVDFSSITDGYIVINAKASDNTVFTIREKSPKGKVIARVEMTVKSERG